MPYKVRFVNPQKQYRDHRREFIKTFDKTLLKGAIVNRQELWHFEDHFAKYAIGVNSGTSALDVAFQAAGLKAGDEVITVAHTFIASISTIYLTGAKPVLIDVGKDFNIDVKQIEKALSPKTKAIVPVHLNGRICDMDVIMDIAKRKGLIVIEDAAQALGATFKMADGNIKKSGTFGLVGCFSLYWAKTLGGWGNNGMAVTDDQETARKIKLMRYNGEDRESRHFYYHAHNLLMDNVQAALLDVKFKYLAGWLKRRKEIANLYKEGLSDVKEVVLPFFNDARFDDVYTNFAIRVEKRDEFKKYLDDNQLFETLISWPQPTYTEPMMLETKDDRLPDSRGWRFGDNNATSLPETEKICKEVISLPMYPELTNKEVNFIIKTIKDFYEE